ncbi:MAG: N-acetylmuramoyl-L-alanine amidase [Bacillota bacterium]
MINLLFDPGHGGTDPGANRFGLEEADVVLELAEKTGNYILRNYEGVRVHYTRTSDTTLALGDRTGLANLKHVDFMYSFHNNSHTTPTAHGFETFVYTSPSSKSVTMQNVIHAEIMKMLKPYGITDRGKKKANLHIVRESKMPSVLAEYLFISNKRENDLLRNENFLYELAKATAVGIAKALGLKEKVKPVVKEAVKVKKDEVKGHWAEKDLVKAEKKGVLTRNNGDLRPNDVVTRAEMAAILNRLGLLD